MSNAEISKPKIFWNVGRKVCLFAIAGISVLFALLTFTNWQLEKEKIYEIMIDSAVVKTELLAGQIVGGVRWYKPEAIWRSFDHLIIDDNYTQFDLQVFDTQGGVILEHRGLHQTFEPTDINTYLSQEKPYTQHTLINNHAVIVVTPVSSAQGKIYGAVVMVWSLKKAKEFLEEIIITELILFIIFTSISGVFLIYVINRSVGSVLTSLSKEMVLVTQNKHTFGSEFLIRNDEFGLMARSLEIFKKTTDDLNKVEKSLLKKKRQLEKALENEQKQNAMQRDFVSMTSHEFRTPLAIIDGSVQRLQRRIDNLDKVYVEERIKKIKNATQRMVTLIDSTLSASRIEAGEVDIELSPVDLAGVVANLCISHQEISEGHKITYDVRKLPRNMLADNTKLRQIFTNLLSNAVKYSPGATEIIVKGYIEKSRAYITVQDFGIGISQADWVKIFDRYFRSNNTTGISGTGIGLCLVLSLLELHGGSISVESEVDAGSIFKVQLPINNPGDEVAEIIDLPLISRTEEQQSLDEIMNSL